MLQQWARRYQRVAFPRYRPQKRARIHAFFRRGVEVWHIPNAVEALPLLLHTSLFVFFSGLSVFMYTINRTIFKVVTTWIGLCVTLYVCLSIFPIIRKDSPYYTPLSAIFSFFITGIRYLFVKVFPGFHKRNPDKGYDYFSPSMIKTAEQHAIKLSPDIDSKSLSLTFDSLDDEADFEEFFEGLPRLCESDTGKKLDLEETFIEPNKMKLSSALIGLMDRTLKPNPFKESVKHRRMIIFTKAMESESTSLIDRSYVLRRVLLGDWDGLLRCMEFGLSMRNWADNFDKATVTSFYAQCVAALTISDMLVQKRLAHDRQGWIQLVKNLSTPFRPHVAHEHDDDILLADALFVVRTGVQAYSGSEENEWDNILEVSRRTLRTLCMLILDIRKSSPKLQNEFCDLWNKLVTTAQSNDLRHRTIAIKMLKNMRKLYIAFHSTPQSLTAFHAADDWEQILDNSELYPQCEDEDHRCSTVFPVLQFNAPPSQPVTRSESAEPTQAVKLPPRFPEPHIPTHNLPPTPLPSPDQKPPPEFPDAHRFVPSSTGKSAKSSSPSPSAPGFPDAQLFVPPSAGNSSSRRAPGFPAAQLFVSHSAGNSSESSPHTPSVPRGQKVQ